MKRWMKRIRGALGMGLIWGAAAFTGGMLLLLIVGPDAADVPFPLGFALLGFLAGVTFGGIVALVEGRRRFEQISLPRFAMLGGGAGLLFSGAFVTAASLGADVLLILAPLFTVLGAGCAAGSLALARRAASSEARDLLACPDGARYTRKLSRPSAQHSGDHR